MVAEGYRGKESTVGAFQSVVSCIDQREKDGMGEKKEKKLAGPSVKKL